MRKGRVRPIAGLLLVLGLLFGGFGMPVSAEEGMPAATPAVTGDADGVSPVVTEELPGESPVLTETPEEPEPGETTGMPAPTSGPAGMGLQAMDEADEAEVAFSVSTADSDPLPERFKLCMWDGVNGTRCSEPAVSTWTVSVPAGWFNYWTEFQEPYLEIDVYSVPVAAGETLPIAVVLEQARVVDVTFAVSTSDGGAVPDALEVCVSDIVHGVQCSDPGVSEWTVAVLGQSFNYWTHRSAQYIDVDVDDVSLPGNATIEIVLEPDPEMVTNITKVVSDTYPAPGSEVTYTVHAWGTSPLNAVSIEDFLPEELTNASFSCEIAAGMPEWVNACDDWWIPSMGMVIGGIDPDDQGIFDVTFTVTATVPDEPGISFVNTACVFGMRGATVAAATGPIAGSECAAASVLTRAETETASVTVNVATEDEAPLPAGTMICVISAGSAEPACSSAGLSGETFPVAAGTFMYAVLAPGYAPATGDGEVAAGETAVVDVVLEAETGSDMHITKVASDENPEPGERISYEIRVWGETPSLEPIQFVDLLPAELSDVRVSCELVTGWTNDPSCAYPRDGMIVGSIVPDDYNDDADEYEMVVTVTGTVTDEPGVAFTNLACIYTEAGEDGPEVTRDLAAASLLGACAAATVTTQEAPAPDPDPEPGTWGAGRMTVDVAEARPGDTVTYTVTLPWQAAAPAVTQAPGTVLAFAQPLAPGFVITDTVPFALVDVAWTCEAVNATCAPELGSGYNVTAEGEVIDPAQDAMVTLTITGTVAEDAPAGGVLNVACVYHDAGAPPPVLTFQQPACFQVLEATFVVLAQPVDPTPTPTPDPVDPTPTATIAPTEPVDPADPTVTPTATAAPSETPGVTPTATPDPASTPVAGLPKTGAAPGAGAGSTLGLVALVAAALLGAGALALSRFSRQR